MGVPPEIGKGAVRLSVGRFTTAEEVDFHFPENLLNINEKEPCVDIGNLCLRQSRTNGKQYVVFVSERKCQEAGFIPLGSDFDQETK